MDDNEEAKIAYAMTKAAINAFTKSVAKELGPRGITVNAVGPGVTNTEMNARWLASPQGRARVASLSPLNRVGEASDIAGVVASLVSNDGRWITGSYVDASGGSLLG
jgi:NAD(P)-dependent dehydrogenase (short-subunit alcohol dehydrogenase family)